RNSTVAASVPAPAWHTCAAPMAVVGAVRHRPHFVLRSPRSAVRSRRMRTALAALMILVGLAGLARVHGQEPAAPPVTQPGTPEPHAPITHTTTVEGTLPDLEGRWLLLASLGLGQSAKRILPSVFDVRRSDGNLEVRERHVVLPPEQK